MVRKLKDFLKTREGKIALTVASIVLGVIGVSVVISDTDNNGTIDQVTITVNEKKDRAPGLGAEETEITVPKAVIENPARVAPDLAEGLHDESPAGTPPAQIDAADRAAERIQATDPLPLSFPLASTSYAGCKTRFVRNQSSRNGVTPQQFWVHYTAGGGTVDTITALFDRASFQASSNFVHDRQGHCNYIVPTYRKAWTQAGANPFAISTEVINTGSQKPFMTKRGYRQLGRTIARVNHQFPSVRLQTGRVSGCRPTRSGIVTHWMGGQCSGGHVDIRPFVLTPVIKAAKRARCKLYRKTEASKSACLRRL